MDRYTPGPWETRKRTDGLENIYCAGTDFDVALCAKPVDARLIAAAPELLEALLGLLKETGNRKMDVKKDYHLMVAVEYAKTTIAKVEG